jgi:hypothetical protein
VHHQQHHRQRVLQPVQQQLGRLHHPAWICRSSLASQATPEPIPDGEQLHMSHGQQLHMLCSCFLAGFGSCLPAKKTQCSSVTASQLDDSQLLPLQLHTRDPAVPRTSTVQLFCGDQHVMHDPPPSLC